MHQYLVVKTAKTKTNSGMLSENSTEKSNNYCALTRHTVSSDRQMAGNAIESLPARLFANLTELDVL